MSTAEWLALLTLCTVSSFTPGPNTTLSTSMAATAGLRATLPFIAGVPVGWSALLILSVTGMSAVLLEHPTMRQGLVIAGSIYLLWLAQRIFRSGNLQISRQAQVVGFWGSVALQFLNIKAWLLAMTISSGWLLGQEDMWSRWFGVWPVVAAYAFASNYSYALVGSSLQRWLQTGQRLRLFNGAMSLMLVALAGWLTLTQL
jgi:threonine/homoserine/homoserine lactone efflux protein